MQNEKTKELSDANECQDFQEKEYKSLLILNETNDGHLTIYIYPSIAPLCVFSTESKIIEPKKKYLYRSKRQFKFQLVAKFGDNRRVKKLLKPEKWTRDKVLKIDESLKCTEEDLANFPEEHTICLRKIKELASTNGLLNLYSVLGLDMKEMRKMEIDELKKSVKEAFHEKIKIWHPDKQFGDDEIAKKILVAREILLDDERRTCYHNEIDYDKGWFSPRRYKAVFWPECFTEEQNRAYWQRVAMSAASFGITICGIALSLSTAVAATPAIVTGGAIVGAGLTAAGLKSLAHTLNKESVVNECDGKEWLSKGATGFAAGAITAGTAAGITAGIANLGGNALKSAAGTVVGKIGIGSATGAIGGITSSLASDAGRKFSNNESITAKQMIRHAVTASAIGATAGALGGLAAQGVLSHRPSTAILETEVGRQVFIQTGAKSFADTIDTLAVDVSRELTESGTKSVIGTATHIVEERLDDKKENQHPVRHVVRGIKDVFVGAIKVVAKEGSEACFSHAKTQLSTKRNEQAYEFASAHSTGDCISSVETEKNDPEIYMENDDRPSAAFEPQHTDETFKRDRKSSRQNNHKEDTADYEEDSEDYEKDTEDYEEDTEDYEEESEEQISMSVFYQSGHGTSSEKLIVYTNHRI